jgi:hypothetical protein
MTRALQIAGFAALVLLAGFLACAAWCACALQGDLALLHWKISTLDTAKLNDATGTLNQKLAAVDVEKLNRAIADVGKTISHIDGAVVLVKQQLDQLDPRTLNTIALHVDKTVGHIDRASHDEVMQQREVSRRTLEVLDDTSAAVKAVLPVIAQLQVDLAEANATLQQTTGTMTNVNHTTEQLDKKVTEILKPAAFARRMLGQAASSGAMFLNWWRALR